MGTQTLRQFFEDSLRIENYEPDEEKMQCMINSCDVLTSKHDLNIDTLIESHSNIVSFQENAAVLTGLRKCNVQVGDSLKISHEEVPDKIDAWIKKFNMVFSNMYLQPARHVMQRVCDLHFSFEMIHPFKDGNGRMGRNLWLVYFSRTTEYLWLGIPISRNDFDKEVPWFLQYAYYNNFRYIEEK